MSKFWQFKNIQNNANTTPELLVYGDIGEWWADVDSKSFAEQLGQITSADLNVRINSYGGEVFTASAIYSMLKRHPANINVFIDGIAASAASVIAMAGDNITMPANAMLMIHNPLTFAAGNANDMRDVADMLDKVRETLVATYRQKTGLDDAAIIDMLDAETWLTASEALEHGFIDHIEHEQQIAASASAKNLVVNGLEIAKTKFKNMPQNWLEPVKNQDGEPGDQDEKSAKAHKEQIVTPQNSNPTGTSAGKPQNKEPTKMDLATLQAEHPELFAQVKNQGVKEGQEAERARIQSIENLSEGRHLELANAAKFDEPITAEQLAVKIINAENAKRESVKAQRDADNASAKPAAAGAHEPQTPEQVKAQEDAEVSSRLAARANAKRSAKKRAQKV